MVLRKSLCSICLTNYFSALHNNFSYSLIYSFQFAVMILEKCIFYEILDYLKSTKQYKSLVRFERGPLKDGNPGYAILSSKNVCNFMGLPH